MEPGRIMDALLLDFFDEHLQGGIAGDEREELPGRWCFGGRGRGAN